MDVHWLSENPRQLSTQLLGRLARGLSPEIDRLADAAAAVSGETWLRPLQPSLLAPGGAVVRVMRGAAAGHTGTVRSIAIDPRGRWLVTAGNSHPDQSVIIWNLLGGTHRRLPEQAQAGGYCRWRLPEMARGSSRDTGTKFGSSTREREAAFRALERRRRVGRCADRRQLRRRVGHVDRAGVVLRSRRPSAASSRRAFRLWPPSL